MRKKKNRIFKVLVILAAGAILIAVSQSITPIRTNLADTASPMLKPVRALLRLLERLVPFAGLREENRILHERVDLLTRMAEETQAVKNENDRLRKLLDFKKSIPFSSIPAQVVGRDPSNWTNSLIIDKGSLKGIRKNMAVMSTRGLVGRVVAAGRNYSKILLITDPNMKVGVLIRRTSQGGVLAGSPGSRCKMIYIALDSDAKPGDIVITAGFGSVFPKGILVGTIEKVGREEGRLYKYAIVRPSQDLSMLEEVLCIIR